MNVIAEVINRAADLISRPGGWTQHTDARDAKGGPVAHTSERAVSFCAQGAIMRSAYDLVKERATSSDPILTRSEEIVRGAMDVANEVVASARNMTSIVAFNDSGANHVDAVVGLLRSAAAHAEKTQAQPKAWDEPPLKGCTCDLCVAKTATDLKVSAVESVKAPPVTMAYSPVTMTFVPASAVELEPAAKAEAKATIKAMIEKWSTPFKGAWPTPGVAKAKAPERELEDA